MDIVNLSSADRKKRRAIKLLEREINRSRYKFYRVQGNLALPGLAKFFFDIYKVTMTTAGLLPNAKSSTALKTICIESFMDTEHAKILALFSSNDTAKNDPAEKNIDQKDSVEEIESKLYEAMHSFDKKTIQLIDHTYSQILMFINFIAFDYYFLLKKFDFQLLNNPRSYTPLFKTISGNYVNTELKDFLEVLLILDFDADWTKVFDVLSAYKGMEIINRPAWKQLMAMVRKVANANIIPIIIQYLDRNPDWTPSLRTYKTRMAEKHLSTIKQRAKQSIENMRRERKMSEIKTLCMEIFNGIPAEELHNYNSQTNGRVNTLIGKFHYTQILNYIHAFFTHYYHKDLQELVNFILIRGKWTIRSMSQQLSDPYFQLSEISDRLEKFDNSLHEDSDIGRNFKDMLGRIVLNDISSHHALQILMEKIDANALSIIQATTKGSVIFGRAFRYFIEDCQKHTKNYITNWTELIQTAEFPLKSRMLAEYKRMHYFVKLLNTSI